MQKCIPHKQRIPIFTQKRAAEAALYVGKLLLHDLQNFHGACLDADTAGDALGSGILRLQDHDLHGAGLDTLAAADALLLVDHVDAGLGILGDGFMLAGLHALAALDAGHGLGCAVLIYDLDAAQILMEFLVKSLGASAYTLQAGHTFNIFLNGKLLHLKRSPFQLFLFIIQNILGNSKSKFDFTGGNFLCIRRYAGNTMVVPSK